MLKSENLWKRTHPVLDKSSFKSFRILLVLVYHGLILTSKKTVFLQLISDNRKRLLQTVDKLIIHRKTSSPLPSTIGWTATSS